jgi:hypothetical protein
MKKIEQPTYNRVLSYSNVGRITGEADSFSVSPSECLNGTWAWHGLEVGKSSKTWCFSLFFMIWNAVRSGHIVTPLADQNIVTLTLWTCIRKVLGSNQRQYFSSYWSSTQSHLQASAGVIIWLGDDRFLTNRLQFIFHESSELRGCMFRNVVLF